MLIITYDSIFTFTSDSLAEAIVNKKKEGLSIRGITDNNSDFPGKLKYMQDNGVDVIDHSPSSQLHHKYAIIDAEYVDSDPVVITGSHNWTWSANNINDESTLFIHDSDIALSLFC
jgi:phosphatidylserine/phosphatidylglycerophosphate/cardiolipin synthase-like enzyme